MGVWRTLSVVAALIAIGMLYFCPIYPESVEPRFKRGLFSGFQKAQFVILLGLERMGLTSPTAYILQNISKSVELEDSARKSDSMSVVSDERFNDVPTLVIKPRAVTENQAKGAGVIYIHGGGFVRYSAKSHFEFTKLLAMETNTTVFSIDYRLAPKFAFPSAIEDAVKASTAIFEQAERFGVDPSQIFIAGESAGGTLAAVVTMELPERYKFRGALLISPWLQMANLRLPSYQRYNKYFTVNLEWYFANYAGVERYSYDTQRLIESNSHVPAAFQNAVAKYFSISKLPEDLRIDDMANYQDTSYPVAETVKFNESDLANKAVRALSMNKRAWPLIADDDSLKKLTVIPVFVQYNQFDSLRDEAILFANRLRSLGGNVRTSYIPGSLHAEPILIKIIKIFGDNKAASLGVRDVYQFIKDHI